MKPAATASLEPTTPVAHYDAITLALERIDALAAVLQANLTHLADHDADGADDDEQLYGLSILVGDVREKHQIIRSEALKLFDCLAHRQPKAVMR